MSKTVIKFENLSKIYRLGEVGTGTISHDLNRWWKMNILGQPDPYTMVGHTNDRTAKAQKGEVVYALKDIDFEVKEGEVLGIIGRNGAGKSTLLKILSKVTSPSTGCIKVKGRIASLLEVGTGFNPEMTGRENIYMNGTIMGMRKWEIDKKLEEIVDFAGVAKYIDTPTKRYSSGMTVRLGFAVAAHLEPEILVVDEVLAVGDAEFQKKAIGKMQEVSQGQGRTVLFVSHNMGAVKSLCTKGIQLVDGTLNFEGGVNEVVNNYLSQNVKSSDTNLKGRKDRKGNQWLKFNNIRILNKEKFPTDHILTGDEITIELTYEKQQSFDSSKFLLSIVIFNYQEQIMAAFPSDELGTKFLLEESGEIRLQIQSLNLRPGNYYISIYSFYESTSTNNYIDQIDNIYKLNIHSSDYFKTGKLIREGNYPVIKATYTS